MEVNQMRFKNQAQRRAVMMQLRLNYKTPTAINYVTPNMGKDINDYALLDIRKVSKDKHDKSFRVEYYYPSSIKKESEYHLFSNKKEALKFAKKQYLIKRV